MSGWVDPVGPDRHLSDLGPPNSRVVAAFLLGIAIAAGLWYGGIGRAEPWLLVGGACAITSGLVALTDRNGWLAREALAYIAETHLARWKYGEIPETPAEAAAWLADPKNATASAIARASVLCTADDWEGARAVLEAFSPATELERVMRLRLLAGVEGHPSGAMDILGVRQAAGRLSVEDARYQIAAAASTQAWFDMVRSKPWRDRFADNIRDLAPFPLPALARAELVARQMSVPIVVVAVAVIVDFAG